MPDIVDIVSGPYAAGSTPVYTGQIVDVNRAGVPANHLNNVTLSIVDTQTGVIINGVSAVSILNADRGTVDANGNLTIVLKAGDTSMSEVPNRSFVRRSLVIDFVSGVYVGRHQVNFTVTALAGP